MFTFFSRNKKEAHPHNPNQGPLISINGLNKRYESVGGDTVALKDINIEIQRGEFVGIIGKSGAGKSTLVNMITGIDKPSSGSVTINGEPIHTYDEGKVSAWRGENMGVVFQFFQLIPKLSCLHNVMLPMDFCNVYPTIAEQKERAMFLLEQMGIAEHAYKPPSAVSGGQRQRVAIARALANNPLILAADEPTGNLDSKTADAVFTIFEELVAQGTTIVMVSHDRELASRVNRVVELVNGEIVASAADQNAADLIEKQKTPLPA